MHTQKELESPEEFIADLINLAKSSEYKSLEDKLNREGMIVGIQNSRLSETLQMHETMDKTLTLQKAIIDKIIQSERIKEENEQLRAKIENVSQMICKTVNKKNTCQKNGVNIVEQKITMEIKAKGKLVLEMW